MNIVVCYKVVPDAEDIEARPDRSISLAKASWKISDYDLQAIEAGVRLFEAHGGKVSGLSAGPRESGESKIRKDALSRGPDDLFLVIEDSLRDADSHLTAGALAAAVKKMGGFDLIICGEASGDLLNKQVGIQLGELLGLPVINAVSKIELVDGKVKVERTLEDEIEVLEVSLPAVVVVTTGINEPRLPTMKEILKAGKKPVTEWHLADLSLEAKGATEVVSILAPERTERKGEILEGDAKEVSQKLVKYLSEEAVI